MIEKLRSLIAGDPFQPFTISLADGRHFEIRSPDIVWLPAGGRGGLHIFVPEKDWIESVNVMLMSSVGFRSPNLPEQSAA